MRGTSELVFPALVFTESGVWVASHVEQLSNTQESLLRAGLYKNALIVDSGGTARRISEVVRNKKGSDLFSLWRRATDWSGRIKVSLIFAEERSIMPVEELRRGVLSSLEARSEARKKWDSGLITWAEFKERLKRTRTYTEIIEVVEQVTTIRPELL